MTRPIDRAKELAAAEAVRASNRRNKREADDRANSERMAQLAQARLTEDYDKWLDKIMRAAKVGAVEVSCRPFDNLGHDHDYDHIVRHHGDLAETWERVAGSEFSPLQYAYLSALGRRLEADGFTVKEAKRVESVPDYGIVHECSLTVTGWAVGGRRSI